MKYLLALFGSETEGGMEDVSPEEMQAAMEPWNELSRQLNEAGIHLASEGLQPSSTATTVRIGEDGSRTVLDGPFAETKEQLGGFFLLDCDSAEQALEWAKKVPLQPGGSIEVRPVMDYTQFGYEDPNLAEKASS
jgi:hypothetical protein